MPCHMRGMTTGHLFLVAHPRGDEALHVTYAVAGADRQATQDVLVAGLAEPGVNVLYARALSADEIGKLGLEVGKYRSVWPTREL